MIIARYNNEKTHDELLLSWLMAAAGESGMGNLNISNLSHYCLVVRNDLGKI